MKMRSILVLGAAASWACCAGGAAHAVITHPSDDAVLNTVPQPSGDVVGRWDVDGGANASAVAIGPNHIVTTRHQGSGGVGSIVQFGGIRYKVAQETLIGSADLRVLRITQEFSSAPANLANFTPVFTGDDDPPPNLDVSIGGFGRARGATLTESSSGNPYGYLWDATPANVNQTTVRFGRNIIDSVDTTEGSYPFPSDLLVADFDRPNPTGDGVVGEASISEFDSGGGWFVEVSPGVWQVAALSLGVDHTGPNANEPGSRALFASHLDPSVNAPDLLAGVRLSSYANLINAAVPEPGTGAVVIAGVVAALGSRRRRGAAR